MSSDPLRWETIDRRVAYPSSDFDVVAERVRLPDGTETDFDYVTEADSVCILPLTADAAPEGDSPTVVTIEEWRQAVDRLNVGLPVGNVDPDDDDIEAAARRELREETGYEAAAFEHLVTVEPMNGTVDSEMHFFVGRGCRPASEQQLDHDETIRVTPTPLEKLVDAVDAGAVRDGRTVLAISYYRSFDRGARCDG